MTTETFSAELTVHQVYITPCYSCAMTIDLVAAPFCRCIVRERTLACRRCGDCACAASFGLRSHFWKSAPPLLQERREQEREDGLARLQSINPRTLPRPFVVIVDDDPLVLAVADRAFRAIGYTTLLTTKPEEAHAIAMALLPDLLVTDALMPKLDGRELCLRLKSSALTQRIKVVIMSGLYRGMVHRNQAFKTFHADEYVSKPFTPAVVRETVARLMPSTLRASSLASGARAAAS